MYVCRSYRINGASFALGHGNADSGGLEHFTIIVPVAECNNILCAKLFHKILFLKIMIVTRENMDLTLYVLKFRARPAEGVGGQDVYFHGFSDFVQTFPNPGQELAVNGQRPGKIGDEILKSDQTETWDVYFEHNVFSLYNSHRAR